MGEYHSYLIVTAHINRSMKKNYYFWRWIELGGGESLGVYESRCACGSGVYDIFNLLVTTKAIEGDARGRI